MKETANFGLKKPEENDFYDVNTQNDNMDTIDRVMHELNEKQINEHTQSASTITEGTFAGKVVGNATAVANLGEKQFRNIYAGTAELTSGTSALPTGDIYIQYE